MLEFNQYLTELLRHSPGLGVAIMMNNYFHDMATGLLVGRDPAPSEAVSA